jgi:hypothetical protein
MDDDELIAALAAGDDAALRELFTRHAPWLAARLRAGSALTGRAADAERLGADGDEDGEKQGQGRADRVQGEHDG